MEKVLKNWNDFHLKALPILAIKHLVCFQSHYYFLE